jgi:hypothetical protein
MIFLFTKLRISVLLIFGYFKNLFALNYAIFIMNCPINYYHGIKLNECYMFYEYYSLLNKVILYFYSLLSIYSYIIKRNGLTYHIMLNLPNSNIVYN